MRAVDCLTAVLPLSLLLTAPAFADVDPIAASEPRTFTAADGTHLPYRLLQPATVEPGKAYPLVLFLHGAGGRGTDNQGQIRDQPGALKGLANEPVRSAHPCFVVAPQCPNDKRWVDVDWNHGSYRQAEVKLTKELGAALELVEALSRDLPVNPRQRYSLGLSMGGYGTWDVIERRPELWAAGIACCGAGDPSRAEAIKAIPMRAFHGDKDGVVPVTGSREMVAALKAAGGTVEYTEFAGVGHDSWYKAFSTPGLWDWLFAQQRQG